MVGNQQHQAQTKDFKDPFVAGQMVGMLMMLTYIEQNNGIPKDMLERIKSACADNVQEFFQKPTEDIFLMVDNMVADIKNL